ncbi:hypothetical protein AB0D04_36615 [Streptomyces sp. NPDC048483]|uniref:hypothetical protein n=1 Tax=Streptomyces sp. NPDC048483 TaxID=3154927 RepID=UPI0034164D54
MRWAIEDITHGSLLAQGTLSGRTRIVKLDPALSHSRHLHQDAPQLIGVLLAVGYGAGKAKVSWHAPATYAFTGRFTGRFTGDSPALGWWLILLDRLLRNRADRKYRRNRRDRAHPQVIKERRALSGGRKRTGTALRRGIARRWRRWRRWRLQRPLLCTLALATTAASAVAATAVGTAVAATLLRGEQHPLATAVFAGLGILLAVLATAGNLLVHPHRRRWMLNGFLVLAVAGTFALAFWYPGYLPWLKDWGTELARLLQREGAAVSTGLKD